MEQPLFDYPGKLLTDRELAWEAHDAARDELQQADGAEALAWSKSE